MAAYRRKHPGFRASRTSFGASLAAIALVLAAAAASVIVMREARLFAGIALLLVAIAVVNAVARAFVRHRRARRLAERLAAAIDRHAAALVAYYLQSRSEDQFGNIDDTKWRKHVDVFLRTQVVADTGGYRAWRSTPAGQHAARRVHEATVKLVAAARTARTSDVGRMTALEYEQYCAALLRAGGWTVRLTPATGDSGADLVAEKDDLRLVVQCKRHLAPVGNKAVQEVHSAVRLYFGDIACVVAPSGFTRQAQQEACGLSIHLLHHSALSEFARKLAA